MPRERKLLTRDYSAPGKFVTTHWSVVLSAKNGSAQQANSALGLLYQAYRFPLYSYVRSRGYAEHDAEDLIQELFEQLIAKDGLRTVDPSKGRFRTFLLAVMRNFLAKGWRRTQTQKRGGGINFVSLDGESDEQQYLQLRSPSLSPEQLYDQQWANRVMSESLNQLRENYVSKGKAGLFDALKDFLVGDRPETTYAELAKTLRTTEAALKVGVRRMRQRYAQLVRAEIAKTVNDPNEIEAELQALRVALCL